MQSEVVQLVNTARRTSFFVDLFSKIGRVRVKTGNEFCPKAFGVETIDNIFLQAHKNRKFLIDKRLKSSIFILSGTG